MASIEFLTEIFLLVLHIGLLYVWQGKFEISLLKQLINCWYIMVYNNTIITTANLLDTLKCF